MGLWARGLTQRARRALERQLQYQQAKAAALAGQEHKLVESKLRRAADIRQRLETVRPIGEQARVLEVGCGAHGLVFFFGAKNSVGVDPLADHYAKLFPAWQKHVQTFTAFGEQLPFEDDSFDVVLCDNVVDHAENPRKIVEEIARVLAPGGILYFEVNIHHPVYHAAASVHAAWRALGAPFEVTPFADHTVHLTSKAATNLFRDLPLRIVAETNNIAEVKRRSGRLPLRQPSAWFKRFFFKNAAFEVIALSEK